MIIINFPWAKNFEASVQFPVNRVSIIVLTKTGRGRFLKQVFSFFNIRSKGVGAGVGLGGGGGGSVNWEKIGGRISANFC